jgi:hypothetical protein
MVPNESCSMGKNKVFASEPAAVNPRVESDNSGQRCKKRGRCELARPGTRSRHPGSV